VGRDTFLVQADQVAVISSFVPLSSAGQTWEFYLLMTMLRYSSGRWLCKKCT